MRLRQRQCKIMFRKRLMIVRRAERFLNTILLSIIGRYFRVVVLRSGTSITVVSGLDS